MSPSEIKSNPSIPAAEASAVSGAPAIELSGIVKRFGSLIANNHIDLSIAAGEVHALVGENGAGKSTLMHVLMGILSPEEGSIKINGKSATHLTPHKAIALGMGMVHQHFMLVENFTVAENIMLGHEPRRGLVLETASVNALVGEIGQKYGLTVSPTAKISSLSVGERQRVEIIKVLYRGARILILDEPTAVLTPPEIEGLFRVIHKFREEGRTVVLITHKLDEVMAISERVTVMRQGTKITTIDTASTSPTELAQLMIGHELEQTAPTAPKETTASEPPVLSVEKLNITLEKRPILKDINFAVQRGEILGVAGVQGNGQTELIEALTGLRRDYRGKIKLGAQDISHLTTAQRGEVGLAHVPEDRHARGLVLDFSMRLNSILGRQRQFTNRLGALEHKRITAHTQELIKRFDIRPPNEEQFARALSGGNQQKLILARELTRPFLLLLAAHPTRGVDIGAMTAIHQELRQARSQGKSILLFSTDLEELFALSDRIAVMYKGEILDILPAQAAHRPRIGELMAGIRAKENGAQEGAA